MTATLPAPPRARSTDRPHISFSQIRTYGLCSLQWLLSRSQKSEFVSSSLIFGSAFHEALSHFYQARLEGRTAAKADLLVIFEQTWKAETHPVQYGKTDDQESLFATADRMFDAFLATVKPGEILAVEEPFECHLADGIPPLTGYIDLIEIRQDEDGQKRLHLVDFKTAARKPSVDDMEVDQLALYAIGMHRVGVLQQFDLPLALRYEVVTKTKSPEVYSIPVKPTKQDGKRVIEKAKVCSKGMQAGCCFPNPGWQCSSCGFSKLCAQWPDVLAPTDSH